MRMTRQQYDLGLADKSFLVIGVGGGIGQSTVAALAEAGADVAVPDIDRAAIDVGVGRVEDLGRKAFAREVDVMDEDSLGSLVAEADRALDGLDGLVTVVGGGGGWGSILDTSTEEWDRSYRHNLRYFFVAARDVARSLVVRRSPGSIVGVSSIDGFRATGYHAGYGAFKAGMIHLVKTLASELGPCGIRANSVAPGSTITPGTPDLGDADIRPGIIPLRRRGEAVDVARTIRFLLSDHGHYITGQTVAVDGGATAIGPFAYGVDPREHVLGVTPGL